MATGTNHFDQAHSQAAIQASKASVTSHLTRRICRYAYKQGFNHQPFLQGKLAGMLESKAFSQLQLRPCWQSAIDQGSLPGAAKVEIIISISRTMRLKISVLFLKWSIPEPFYVRRNFPALRIYTHSSGKVNISPEPILKMEALGAVSNIISIWDLVKDIKAFSRKLIKAREEWEQYCNDLENLAHVWNISSEH
jgi:hypothetical protein